MIIVDIQKETFRIQSFQEIYKKFIFYFFIKDFTIKYLLSRHYYIKQYVQIYEKINFLQTRTIKAQQRISQDKFKKQIVNKQIYCPQGKLSTLVCSNKTCNLNAFICEQQSCSCRVSHKLCLKLQTQSIIEIIISKSYSLEPLVDKINNFFQKSINSLSYMRDKILLQFKEKYQLYGLEDNQIRFMNAIKSSKVKEISCSFMSDIMARIHSPKQNLKKMDQIQKDINQIWMIFDQKVKDFQTSLRKYFGNVNLPYSQHFQNFRGSKLMKNKQDSTNVVNFFDKKKIKSTTLLYRASQNDFEVFKFHQKCNEHRDTLTILQTQYGKVIGGYTGIKWNQRPSGNYISASKQQVFLFCLTFNQKIPLFQNKQNAIYNKKDYGPTFGGDHDLVICEKANQYAYSCTHIGYTYNNGKYTFKNQQSKKRFAGGSNFKIVEQQVWKLQFEKNDSAINGYDVVNFYGD